jgi:hypothetical protein
MKINSNVLLQLLLLATISVAYGSVNVNAVQLRESVREMFYHGKKLQTVEGFLFLKVSIITSDMRFLMMS